MSKRKIIADMEANKIFGKSSFTVNAKSEKYQQNEKLLPKAAYQCKECENKARDNYNLVGHMKKTQTIK